MSIELINEILDEKNKEEKTKLAENIQDTDNKISKKDDISEEIKKEVSDNTDELKQSKSIDDYEKKIKGLEKALNDTKKSYQTVNQKNVLAKKNYGKIIEELKQTLLEENNVLVEKEEYDTLFDKLNSVFTYNDEDLQSKEEEETPKVENKGKNILNKLESEFETYKKYNKSKDLDINYKAFFESVHLLNAEERQNILEYLEEAETSDAIEKILIMGKDYRELFENGIKKHKNIFAYVNSLQEQISKLNEEINKYKLSVDNKFDKEDNKQIKHRSSPTQFKIKGGDELLNFVMGSD